MQPHSMAAVAVSNYLWGHNRLAVPKKVTVRVEYQRANGEYRTNYYDITNIEETDKRTQLKMYIMRGGGGISCQITARRSSPAEGNEIEQTHSQQHAAGLREVYRLYKNRISGGQHYNSMKYGNFKGESYHPGGKSLKLYCDVKRKDGFFMTIPYELKVMSISL